MKIILTFFLVLSSYLVISQTHHTDIKVSTVISPLFEKITIKLSSDKDSLSHCMVKLFDSKKNCVKSLSLPSAVKQIEGSIMILDLLPGNYTCLVYKGNEEIYKTEFFKDAIFVEPQGLPVLNKPKEEVIEPRLKDK